MKDKQQQPAAERHEQPAVRRWTYFDSPTPPHVYVEWDGRQMWNVCVGGIRPGYKKESVYTLADVARETAKGAWIEITDQPAAPQPLSDAPHRVGDWDVGPLKQEPLQPLSVEEARKRGVCRICGEGPDKKDGIISSRRVNEGELEQLQAHQSCLDRERAAKEAEPPKVMVRRFHFASSGGRIEWRRIEWRRIERRGRGQLFCEFGPENDPHWVLQSGGSSYTSDYCDFEVSKGRWVEHFGEWPAEPPSEGETEDDDPSNWPTRTLPGRPMKLVEPERLAALEQAEADLAKLRAAVEKLDKRGLHDTSFDHALKCRVYAASLIEEVLVAAQPGSGTTSGLAEQQEEETVELAKRYLQCHETAASFGWKEVADSRFLHEWIKSRCQLLSEKCAEIERLQAAIGKLDTKMLSSGTILYQRIMECRAVAKITTNVSDQVLPMPRATAAEAYSLAADECDLLKAEIARLRKEKTDSDDFMAYMHAELSAMGCKHAPEAHAATPPMMWPEWIACIVQSRVTKRTEQQAERIAALEKVSHELDESLRFGDQSAVVEARRTIRRLLAGSKEGVK